ncbi:hypothetical protein FKP32DRAFT_1425578 [Trametes sanguinea]|nr:hypothetical protein FKP32DRAFT_1425578 [Trametes sanguinea]
MNSNERFVRDRMECVEHVPAVEGTDAHVRDLRKARARVFVQAGGSIRVVHMVDRKVVKHGDAVVLEQKGGGYHASEGMSVCSRLLALEVLPDLPAPVHPLVPVFLLQHDPSCQSCFVPEVGSYDPECLARVPVGRVRIYSRSKANDDELRRSQGAFYGASHENDRPREDPKRALLPEVEPFLGGIG